MMAIDMEVIPQHGCCVRRRFRRTACICNCHDVNVTEYCERAPTTTDFTRTRLRWLVSVANFGRRTVGLVGERLPEDGGGYGVYFDGIGLVAVLEDPWTCVGILSAWSQTRGSSA